MNEPALDLAVVMALVSSFKNREVDPGMLIFGEVGLSGEVRAVSQAGQRVAEAVKMGFTACVLPRAKPGEAPGVKNGSGSLEWRMYGRPSRGYFLLPRLPIRMSSRSSRCPAAHKAAGTRLQDRRIARRKRGGI